MIIDDNCCLNYSCNCNCHKCRFGKADSDSIFVYMHIHSHLFEPYHEKTFFFLNVRKQRRRSAVR